MAVASVGVPGLVLGGCTTRLGPKAIRRERPDFNQQIVRSGEEQMLPNLVRLRYSDTLLSFVVILWLAIILGSVGLFAPSNSTFVASVMLAALSVTAAIFLILETGPAI